MAKYSKRNIAIRSHWCPSPTSRQKNEVIGESDVRKKQFTILNRWICPLRTSKYFANFLVIEIPAFLAAESFMKNRPTPTSFGANIQMTFSFFLPYLYCFEDQEREQPLLKKLLLSFLAEKSPWNGKRLTDWEGLKYDFLKNVLKFRFRYLRRSVFRCVLFKTFWRQEGK